MKLIEAALNKTILLEKEKEAFYFAFDTKELLKGEMNERFLAYKTALDANFMQIDEVRYADDLDPLGLIWIKLGSKMCFMIQRLRLFIFRILIKQAVWRRVRLI